MTIENGIVNVKYNRMKKILILLAAAALVAVVGAIWMIVSKRREQ